MRRGEVWWAEFGDAKGGEIRNRRPVLIVSNDASNRHLNRVQVVPLISNVSRLYPSEAIVTLRKERNKAMADQLTTISKMRLSNRIGRIRDEDMERVERAVCVQLGLRIN